MQWSDRVGLVLLRSPDQEIFVRTKSHRRETPLRAVGSHIREGPTSEIGIERAGVVNLQPVGTGTVLILNPVVVVGHELGNDQGGRSGVWIQRVTPVSTRERHRCARQISDPVAGGPCHRHITHGRFRKLELILDGRHSQQVRRGDVVDEQVRRVDVRDTFTEHHSDEGQRPDIGVGRRTRDDDAGFGSVSCRGQR